ncbi:MAG: chromosome partitioning protein ParB [Candidatus Kerfeldbacteria bacterium CG08_land_8_20_14_0_20_40_16]|uniref:Chromosome partitioning protein ParB n=1 Tax=Candidatus Kerfeldbacteria bacterium CG08_land_8_20_14_0_20_40_16 TaxID=2014244 RepID=A0A2H0YXB1_9BACT|nr:MAG: chromosome partitioning protein ParB [Candidatus Kerfeldbacteria bacterium CG08_land_8_20_14_0_20_40_16]
MKHNSSLGRGLAALIPIKKESTISTAELARTEVERVQEVPVSQIQNNPMQPRHHFDHHSEEELVNSIKEHGIIQPLIVTKTDQGYQLIAGERRLRAAKLLELATVPIILRNASQQQKLEVSLIENIQRQDLNPVEEAQAYRRLMDEFSLTQEQLANRMGKNRATIANIIRVLELPEEVQNALIDRKITIGHAKVLLSLDNPKDQINTFKKILRGNLNIQETTRIIRKIQPKGEKTIDFALQEKEEKLRAALATKVNIEKRGNKGKIVIAFYSSEEMDSLIRKILGNDR